MTTIGKIEIRIGLERKFWTGPALSITAYLCLGVALFNQRAGERLGIRLATFIGKRGYRAVLR